MSEQLGAANADDSAIERQNAIAYAWRWVGWVFGDSLKDLMGPTFPTSPSVEQDTDILWAEPQPPEKDVA